VPPGADGAALEFRAGGSTPAENMEVFSFDAAAIEYVDLYGKVSARYATGNFKVDLPWMAASATSGAVVWEVGVRRVHSGEAFSTAQTYSYQSATTTAPGTNGQTATTSINFTQAQADAIVAGDKVVVRVRRNATAGGDTMTGDAQLEHWGVVAVET